MAHEGKPGAEGMSGDNGRQDSGCGLGVKVLERLFPSWCAVGGPLRVDG